jgi:cobalt/nickel transport system ATP-binding protein
VPERVPSATQVLVSGVRVSALKVWRQQHHAGPRLVLDGVSFDVVEGECVAIAGPNGAGKTTLLLALVGAVPFEGEIEIAGQALTRSSLRELRQETGFVFADPGDQLFLPTVRDEVAFGPEQRGLGADIVQARVGEALLAVGLAGYENRSSSELSLGEQRRLAVATVLSTQPRVILLDEPTASLDPRARRGMLQTIRATGATVLMATHDLEALLELSARVLLLNDGHVIADGPAVTVLNDARALEAAGLEVPLSLRLSPRPIPC